MKLEKHYMSQNKVYDQYSHTLHPHHFLQNQHFEVEEQAKRDKLSQEYDAEMNKFSYCHYEMLQPAKPGVPPPGPFELSPEFTANREAPELDRLIKSSHTRISDQIKRLFTNSIKTSDISYDYIHHMYELYPNHFIHTELIVKSLQVLCDLVTDD